MALAVIVAVEVVVVEEGVGLTQLPKAPAVVLELVLKQNDIVVLAPFAVIEPFRVADVPPTEVAAFVVALGAIAALVTVIV